MTTTPSTNEPKSPDVQQLVTQPTESKQRWWHPSRIADRLLIAVGFFLLSALFMLLGAVIGLIIDHRIQSLSTNIRPGGVGPGLAPGHSPGVQFLSELTPLFDVIPPETRVQVCFHGVNTDVGAAVVLIDHQTFTMRQMRDALKIVAALEPPASRQKPSLAPSPISTGVDVESCPVWIDVDRAVEPRSSQD